MSLMFYSFWTIISYYITISKIAIISPWLISILFYQLFLLVSLNAIISIKTILWHLFLIKCIMSLISFDMYYIDFFLLLCQLLLWKHIMTPLKHLFLFKYIICIMSFNAYYVNYLYDNELFQLFWIISFQLK